MPIPPSPPTVQVKNAGTLVGTRRGINFLAGTGITRTITDDAANNEVEVTLAQDLPTEGSVRVYHNAAQSITTGVTTALAFNSERYDSDGYHDPVTNNTRLTVPAGKAGKYVIFATISWSPVADATWRMMTLRVTGATHIARQAGPNVNTASFGLYMNLSCTYDLAVGDYVEVLVRHERGSALDTGSEASFVPEFGMSRIGGVLASGGSAAAAHVARVANQAITTVTDTAVSFDTETRDDGAFWSAGSPTRLTAPATGWYNVAGYVLWEANTTGIRYATIKKNNDTFVALVSSGPHATDGTARQTLAINLYLTAGDYLELVIQHNRGANLNATGTLSIAKIGLG